MPRDEKLELPEDALREAVLNAIAHCDYRVAANIQVYIFSDRVEVVNPGGLVGGLKKEDLGKRSMPRNPLLFSMMERMDLVEKVGSGILRMKDAMKEYGLKEPAIETDENWFSITFVRDVQKYSMSNPPVNPPVNTPVNTPVNLNQSQQQIFNCLKENPYITYCCVNPEMSGKQKKLGIQNPFFIVQPLTANEPTPSASQPINGGTLLWVAYTLISLLASREIPLRRRGRAPNRPLACSLKIPSLEGCPVGAGWVRWQPDNRGLTQHYDELAEKLKKNRSTIRLNIKKLKSLNLLERIGSDKKGHWLVKNGAGAVKVKMPKKKGREL